MTPRWLRPLYAFTILIGAVLPSSAGNPGDFCYQRVNLLKSVQQKAAEPLQYLVNPECDGRQLRFAGRKIGGNTDWIGTDLYEFGMVMGGNCEDALMGFKHYLKHGAEGLRQYGVYVYGGDVLFMQEIRGDPKMYKTGCGSYQDRSKKFIDAVNDCKSNKEKKTSGWPGIPCEPLRTSSAGDLREERDKSVGLMEFDAGDFAEKLAEAGVKIREEEQAKKDAKNKGR